MVKDHSVSERGNLGYPFRLTARVLLYAPSHRQDRTYHSLCYTSRGALAGTGNSSMGPPHEGSIRRPIAPWANALTTELHLAPNKFGCHTNPVVWVLHWHAVSLWSIPDSEPLRGFSKQNISKEEGKYEIFYLFWAHFIYAYMVLDICKRTTQQLKKPMAYSFRLAVSDVLYALPVVEHWQEWEIAQWFSQKAITPWTLFHGATYSWNIKKNNNNFVSYTKVLVGFLVVVLVFLWVFLPSCRFLGN